MSFVIILLKKNTPAPDNNPNIKETNMVDINPNFLWRLLQNQISITSAYSIDGIILNAYANSKKAGRAITVPIKLSGGLISNIKTIPIGVGKRISIKMRCVCFINFT
jgi:hypothetical protein